MTNTRNAAGAAEEKPATPTVRPARKSGADSAIQHLHPVQVEYSYPLGDRIDMEGELPVSLDDEDPDELLDMMSGPIDYATRIAPLKAELNHDKLSGKNPTELKSRFLQRLLTDLQRLAVEIEAANRTRFQERGPVSFLGLGLDPETIARLIELDYEGADNSYSRLVETVGRGAVTPVGTMPFHSLLPLYQHDFEIRLVCRISLEFYWPLWKRYTRAVAKALGEKYFIATIWFPEGAISPRALQILHQEFVKRCEEEKIAPAHLTVLLDAEQSKEREHDLLVKRWNTLRPSATTRDLVTILYKERAFSDWVIQGHPSTKKQLDRTIAKVDAALREQGKDHLWSHFEPIDTLLGTFKSCQNFEQKLIKLTELGYQPCGPDVIVRRKLLNVFPPDEIEPRRTSLKELSCWASDADNPGSLVRFLGVDGGGDMPLVLGPEAPFTRRLAGGQTERRNGNPCWKRALMAALQRVHRAVVGEPRTFMGGMLGLIRGLIPITRVPVAMRNIEDFLVQFARVHWREHFVHQGLSEADIRLDEYARELLLRDAPANEEGDVPELMENETIAIGAAARAIFLAHEGLSSCAFRPENFDQRATYQNVALMTLAVVHAINALRWSDKGEEADKIFEVFREELLDFENAYQRHGLASLGVSPEVWAETIAPEVDDSKLNVVARAARRVGARHLRNAGYRKFFEKSDEHLSTSTGHFWTQEVDHSNFAWETDLYCGLPEEWVGG